MEAQGSVLTNKYAEGLSEKSAGMAAANTLTRLSNWRLDRAKELFGAEHANVQPHSGFRREHGGLFSPC